MESQHIPLLHFTLTSSQALSSESSLSKLDGHFFPQPSKILHNTKA